MMWGGAGEAFRWSPAGRGLSWEAIGSLSEFQLRLGHGSASHPLIRYSLINFKQTTNGEPTKFQPLSCTMFWQDSSYLGYLGFLLEASVCWLAHTLFFRVGFYQGIVHGLDAIHGEEMIKMRGNFTWYSHWEKRVEQAAPLVTFLSGQQRIQFIFSAAQALISRAWRNERVLVYTFWTSTS